MAIGNPEPAPAPGVLAQMLLIAMWSDHISDEARRYHEWSADVIKQLIHENGRLVSRNERLELDLVITRNVAFGNKQREAGI